MKSNRKSWTGVAAVLAACCVSSAAGASIIANGSFESCTGCVTTGFGLLNNGSGQLANWTVFGTGGPGVDYVNTNYWNAENQSNSLALGGGTVAGGVSQSFSTVVNRVYTVQFYIAAAPLSRKGGNGVKTIAVNATGATTNFDTIGPSTGLQNMDWTQETYTFTATSLNTTLSFFNATGGGGGGNTPTPFNLALDNVTVSAVPEPATWAMLIVGFGLVGGALRRRVAGPALA